MTSQLFYQVLRVRKLALVEVHLALGSRADLALVGNDRTNDKGPHADVGARTDRA